MGWTYYNNKNMTDIIADLICPYISKNFTWVIALKAFRTVEDSQIVLWIVREHENDRWIECILLDRLDDGSWGYKQMCEAIHPYYYSCPVEFLEMVPCACQEWRDLVYLNNKKG